MKVVIPVYGSRRWALVNGKAQKACFSVFPLRAVRIVQYITGKHCVSEARRILRPAIGDADKKSHSLPAINPSSTLLLTLIGR